MPEDLLKDFDQVKGHLSRNDAAIEAFGDYATAAGFRHLEGELIGAVSRLRVEAGSEKDPKTKEANLELASQLYELWRKLSSIRQLVQERWNEYISWVEMHSEHLEKATVKVRTIWSISHYQITGKRVKKT